MTVSILTEKHWSSDAGFKVFDDIYPKEEWVTARYGIICYLLWGDSEGEKEVFFSPDVNAWFLQTICRHWYIPTCIVGCWIWWSGWPACSARGIAPTLNYHLFVDSFCKFFMCFSISMFLVKIYWLEPPSPFWQSVYGNIRLDLTSFGLTSPVSEPPAT
jgi:hypothetical protein